MNWRRDDITITIHDDDLSRLHISWRCRDRTLWKEVLASLRQSLGQHHTGLTYHPDTRSWSIYRSYSDRLNRWAHAWTRQVRWSDASEHTATAG